MSILTPEEYLARAHGTGTLIVSIAGLDRASPVLRRVSRALTWRQHWYRKEYVGTAWWER